MVRGTGQAMHIQVDTAQARQLPAQGQCRLSRRIGNGLLERMQQCTFLMRQRADPCAVTTTGRMYQPAGQMAADGATPGTMLTRLAVVGAQLSLQVGDQQIQRLHVFMQHHAQAWFAPHRGTPIQPTQVDAAPYQGIASGWHDVRRHGRFLPNHEWNTAPSSLLPT